MSIEHSAITDPNIHEPKGISTAGANNSYLANGAGSGTWRKIRSTDFQGITGDSGVANKSVVSDGANGFQFATTAAYGSMTITANSVTATMTAVADTTFNTASQFTLMTGTGFPWAAGPLLGTTFNTDRLVAPVTGVYQVSTYININSFPSTNARISMRTLVNGSTYGARKPTIKSSGAGDEGILVGVGLIALNAGDYVQNVLASDASGTLLIKDANFTLHLVG